MRYSVGEGLLKVRKMPASVKNRIMILICLLLTEILKKMKNINNQLIIYQFSEY